MNDKSKTETYDTGQILEQMREEYWKGITETQDDLHEDRIQVLSFSLAGEHYAVDANLCKTILKIPNITRVPQTPPHVLGVINIRGRITSVVDIRKLFGLHQAELGNRARLVLIEVGESSTAIVTEDLEDIIFMPLSELKPPAKGLTRMKTEFVKGYFQKQDAPDNINGDQGRQLSQKEELLIYLDLEKIMLSPQMIVDYRAR